MKKAIYYFGLFAILISSLLSLNVFAVSINDLQPTGYVVDQANILSSQEKASLDSKLQTIDQTRSAQGALVIVDNLGGRDIESYSTDLFRKFGIGNKQTNNGFLVLISIGDRRSRIEVGYGLEGTLTDLRTGRILQDVKPDFQSGNYATGINKIINDIDGLLASDPETAQKIDSSTTSSDIKNGLLALLFSVWWLPILLFAWLGSILGRTKSWWAGGVIGVVGGGIISIFAGLFWIGIISMIFGTGFGLLFDYLVSKNFKSNTSKNKNPDWWAGGNYPWWFGGGGSGGSWGSGGSSGGFGGFGGGSSGGGGSSSSW